MSSTNSINSMKESSENQNKRKYTLSKQLKNTLSKIENENGPCPPPVPCPQVDPDCIIKEKEVEMIKSIGEDPRFQQQNQTPRCFVMYCDFFHCEQILGDGHKACTWFRQVYETFCPTAWIEKWDELRSQNLMPWNKPAEFGEGPYPK